MPHINYKIDFTSEIYIVNNNKVLLRKHDKYGIWLSVGGHIELEEDPVEAAIREVKEEVGLTVEIIPTSKILNTDEKKYKHLPSPAFINRHKINNEHEHVTFIYFAKTNSNDIKQDNKEISEECRWFSIEDLKELKENISDTVKEYAKHALKTINNE